MIPLTPTKEQSALERSAVLSQRESISRLLNTYLRETDQHTPRYSNPDRPDLTLIVSLPQLQQTIYGNLLHLSDGGHHVYGDAFYTEENGQWQEITAKQLIVLLLDEVSYAEPEPASRQLKKQELEEQLLNSTLRMESYFRHAADQPAAPLDFRNCEQSLLSGHPFHPTPKSLEGFTKDDAQTYSPEFGAAFSLHCFAVSLEYVVEDWLQTSGDQADWIPKEMIAAAKNKLSDDYESYALIPCHPWQAKYLLSLERVKEMIQANSIIDLGLTGPLVYPTSSVRTVWEPSQSCFYKLSLHIRITNFIRENTYEQLQRTLDAAKVVNEIRAFYTNKHFKILLEEGYRTIGMPGEEKSGDEEIRSGFSVILREAPEACTDPDQAPFVIASLLEVPPGHDEPILFRAAREGMIEGKQGFIDWLRQYLQISMKPILHLFAEKGISLEAHVQNSMVSLDNGMPAVFYVRDLEGISVNSDFARREGWIGSLIAADSPVLYSESESRHRLKYYFFVNHLCHLIQRLAVYSGQEEQPFWLVVNDTLQQMRLDSADPYLSNVIDDLLSSDTLPAKANLLSRFLKRGETPLYVNIPNPIRL
jgi:siderophore synthetase component